MEKKSYEVTRGTFFADGGEQFSILQSYASAPEAGFYAGPSNRHAPFSRPIFAAHEMIISEFLEAKARLMVGTDGRLTEQAPWRGYAGVQWRGFHEERGLLVHSQPLDMDTLETLRTKLDASL